MAKTITSKKSTSATTGAKKTVVSENKTTVSQVKEVKTAPAQVATPKSMPADTTVTIITEKPASVPALEINAQNVAQSAYFLWEKEGYQHGRDREYWLRAEEILIKELAKVRS